MSPYEMIALNKNSQIDLGIIYLTPVRELSIIETWRK